jgi:hypothetical protein
MLEKVRFRDSGKGLDVEAYTDGYAYDEYSCLYLLSVGGHDSNVKAITSAVVSGRNVEILSKPAVELWASYGQRFRVLSARLPDAALHQIVAEDGFFRSAGIPENLLYVDEQCPARLVYETIRSGYPVPLVPGWSDWLYQSLKRKGYLSELRGTRKVLRLSVSEETLDPMISEGVSSGEISF